MKAFSDIRAQVKDRYILYSKYYLTQEIFTLVSIGEFLLMCRYQKSPDTPQISLKYSDWC